MTQQEINDIKARAEAAAVHEYDGITDLIYGRDVKALLAEVERLNAENADLKAVVDPVKLAEIAMMLIGFKKLQEKQMPKMVVFPTKNYSNLPVAQCPVCGSKKIGNKYCDDCGQALKWEE